MKYMSDLPREIVSALVDTWPYQGQTEAGLRDYSRRWKRFDAKTFLRVAVKGKEEERLFAIFALGDLYSPEAEAVVNTFAQSAERRERWAATITLGRWRNERGEPALPELLALLLEDIGYNGPEFDWYAIWRWNLASLLGEWGDPLVIPALNQALHTAFQLEQQPLSIDGWGLICENLHTLEDRLAYALGQFQAFDLMRQLNIPPARQRIMALYMIFGSLGVVEAQQRSYPGVASLRHLKFDKNVVKMELASRFGFSDDQQHHILEKYEQDCVERDRNQTYSFDEEAI